MKTGELLSAAPLNNCFFNPDLFLIWAAFLPLSLHLCLRLYVSSVIRSETGNMKTGSGSTGNPSSGVWCTAVSVMNSLMKSHSCSARLRRGNIKVTSPTEALYNFLFYSFTQAFLLSGLSGCRSTVAFSQFSSADEISMKHSIITFLFVVVESLESWKRFFFSLKLFGFQELKQMTSVSPQEKKKSNSSTKELL